MSTVRTRRAALAMAGIAFVAWGPAPLASAEDPQRLPGDVTDGANALGGQEDDVQAALDDLAAGNEVQLFVTYVESFDGRSPQEWADTTAELSGFGRNDALLAVATQDRAYAFSATDFPVAQSDVDSILINQVEPALRDDDWAGAAIGAAEGLQDATDGNGLSVQSSGSDAGDGGSNSFWWILILVAVAGLGLWFFLSRKKKAATTPAVSGKAGLAAADVTAGMSIDELNVAANRLLVETDDAIKTSDQELGFAEAQFGAEATAPFAQALTDAKASLREAFATRARLDDSTPDSDAATRKMLTEIVTSCTQANERLDAEAERFDALRDMEANLPALLESVEAQVAAREQRIPQAEQVHASLVSDYPAPALTTVTSNLEQAKQRVTFARAAVEEGKVAVAENRRGDGVADVRGAEEAIGQGTLLLDSIDQAATDLAEAGGRTQAALAETERDLAEASALTTAPGVDQAALAAATATAHTALTQVRAAIATPDHDPLAMRDRIEHADAALEHVLVGARETAEMAQKAQASLAQAIGSAESQVKAVDDYITTRRGEVGPEARTRLAEAQRLLTQAITAQHTAPQEALAAAQQAHALAGQAGQMAQKDVARASAPQGGGGSNMSSAILGGIMLSSMMGGGSSHTSPARRPSRRASPGSFGGAATRGRRTGGGRF